MYNRFELGYRIGMHGIASAFLTLYAVGLEGLGVIGAVPGLETERAQVSLHIVPGNAAGIVAGLTALKLVGCQKPYVAAGGHLVD